MKNLIIVSVLLAFPLCLTAQTNFDHIKISGRQGEYITVMNVSSTAIEYENSYGVKKTIPVSEVDFLEYDGKVVFYNYRKNHHDIYDEYLQRVSRRDPEKLLEKGAKVYVPLNYGESRWEIMGCINTRKMLEEDHADFWKLANTEFEAEIILFYVVRYDDDEIHHYYVIETRDGETIYKSDEEEIDGGWRASWDVSREHVEDLLDKLIKDID